MEDNEFEEVTIISHTDRPQRVFSEKSIEKLKDQVSLEIVKEINGTEDKTYSDDPRLAPGLRELEKLKQDHFGEGEGKLSFYDTRFISRVAGESGQYLLGTERGLLFCNDQGSKVIPWGLTYWNYLVYWGKSIIGFPQAGTAYVFSLEDFKVQTKLSVCRVWPSKNVQNSDNFVYFFNGNGYLTRINRELKEERLLHKESPQDFFVCPKTETITTLNQGCFERFIQSNGTRINYQQVPHQAGSTFLKKMYSDHFLVGETTYNHRVTLVDYHSLQVLHTIRMNTDYFNYPNIRLLAPRQGISCFLVMMETSLELFCEYRLKLYHLKTLELPSRTSCLGHISGDLWYAGLSYGHGQLVRLSFRRCPALRH